MSPGVRLLEGFLLSQGDHGGVGFLCAGLQILDLFWEVCAYEALLTETSGFLQSLQVGKIFLMLNLCDPYLCIEHVISLDLAVESRIFKVVDGL